MRYESLRESYICIMMAKYLKFPVGKLACTEGNNWARNENTVRLNYKKLTI
jgi:hypothetical protein